MGPRDGNRRRPLSREERVLWKAVTQSIAPLRALPATDDDEPEAEAAAAAAPKVRPARNAAKTQPVVLPAPAKPAAPPPLAPRGRRMTQRAARGKAAIEGRRDLPGPTQSEAHGALLRFLRAAVAREARLVLVITGKGKRESEGGRGVLKRQVPQWLALPEFRALVVGFEDAHLTHGGEGALYVRLRRARGA